MIDGSGLRRQVRAVRLAALLAAASCAPYEGIGREIARQSDAGRPRHIYFISPAGADSNEGTERQPWLTFAHAIPRLEPGDELILLDGTYDSTNSGYPNIICGTNAQHGTAELPISFRAQNERRAFLDGDGSTHPFFMSRCSYWNVEGLRAEGGDFPRESGEARGTVFAVTNGSHHVNLRRLLGAKANRHFGGQVVLVGYGSHDVLVEECEAYEYHYNGFEILESSGITMRRNYATSRDYADLPGSHASDEPLRGDYGFGISGGRNNVLENNVAEDVYVGFRVSGAPGGNSTFDSAVSGNVLIGNVALATAGPGFRVLNRCGRQSPCVEPTRIVERTELSNNAAVRCAIGFHAAGARDTTIVAATVVRALASGVLLANADENKGFAASTLVTRTAVTGGDALGFEVGEQAQWRVDGCNVFGTRGRAYPNDPRVVQSTMRDPQLGGCTVYLPPASPLRGATAATDVGAHIVFRTFLGRATVTRLWAEGTGAFPCGVVVTGVNDSPVASCATVHQRLGIGTSDCPLP